MLHMPETGMEWGDLPAWFALGISIWTATRQNKANAKTEESRLASESAAKTQRETDQRRQRVETIQRDLEDLTALAIDYWMKPGTETGTSGVVINTKIRDISSRFSRYSTFLWPDASSDFLAFKQAVTGGEFQSQRREASTPRSGMISAISSTSILLKDKLRRELDKLDLPTKY